MSNKYKKSFEVDTEDIPRKCPICGVKFNLSDDIDISPYKKGYRSVLMCPKCKYQKVISYTLEEDIEDDEDEFEESDYDENCEDMSKEDMLEELNEHNWTHELTDDSSWEEIKEVYDIMIDECTGDSPLFPNGRDYDAEDEDGPF